MSTETTTTATATTAPIGRHVGHGLRHWVSQAPDRTALTYEGRNLTWQQLERRVACFAAGLLAEGLERGSRFAHVDRNHPCSMEATLAAAYSGVTHVTINWRLAPDELAYAIDDSESEILFVGHEFVEQIEAIRERIQRVRLIVVVGGPADEYEDWIAGQEPVRGPYDADPDDCILQMYTSGTTGRPKGAMMSHRSLGVNASGQAASVELDESSVHLIAMPMFHIGGQAMLMISLRSGARMVLTADPSPASLLALIENERVTHMFLVPTAFDSLISDPAAGDHDLSSLKSLMYSGAPMPMPLLERSLKAFPGALAVHGGYGMTEISGMASSLPPEEHRNPEHPERISSVGQILRGMQWRIVDLTTGRDVEVGEVGQLWLRGPSVILGYWRNPTATQSAIVDGWLRTGDLVRADDYGYIYIVGRSKEMIISGGENIYPAEVERVLHAIDGVVEGCVIGVPDEKFGEAVRAYVVRADGSELTEESVIAACRSQLARFKCPRTVEFIDALPRNTTGKVTKHVLEAQYASRS